MKKIAPVLVTLLLIAIMLVIVISRAKQQGYVTVLSGNVELKPVEILPGKYQDTECGMLVNQLKDSAQAVAPDGKTWFFDDVGCLALWADKNKKPDELVMWVYTRDTEAWIDGRAAWYSRADYTPMHYGFAAYATKQEGFIDFQEMSNKMLRGENLTNPYIRKELRGND